jgi:hypothetical protein
MLWLTSNPVPMETEIAAFGYPSQILVFLTFIVSLHALQITPKARKIPISIRSAIPVIADARNTSPSCMARHQWAPSYKFTYVKKVSVPRRLQLARAFLETAKRVTEPDGTVESCDAEIAEAIWVATRHEHAMERRKFLKLGVGFAVGATALAATAQAAPLLPQPLFENKASQNGDPAETTGDEVERLRPQEVRWGRGHHWGVGAWPSLGVAPSSLGLASPSLGLASSLASPSLAPLVSSAAGRTT